MSEVNVVRQPKPERPALDRYFKFDTPLLRGSLFGVNPFALMRQFTDDMDKMFAAAPAAGREIGTWAPPIELKEKDGKLFVTAELPGVKAQDVKVHVEGETLVVEGERKEEKEEKREGFYHSERSYGKFYRAIALPEGTKVDATAANFKDGILEVVVPIPQVKKITKEIPINEGTKKAA